MSTKEVWKRLLGFLWQFKGLLLISFICAAISVWLNVLAPLLIGNIIEQEFSTSMNWNLGSGLSIALMIFVLISMMFTSKTDAGKERSVW